MIYYLEVYYEPDLIRQFIDNELDLPYKVTLYEYIHQTEQMFIELNWFKEDIDIAEILNMKSISDIDNYIKNKIINTPKD